MRRFSRLFWFTILAGTLSSALLSCALVSRLTARLNEMVTRCTAKNFTCSTESIDRAFQVFCLAEAAAILLLFWTAHRIGIRLIKPAPHAVTEARDENCAC